MIKENDIEFKLIKKDKQNSPYLLIGYLHNLEENTFIKEKLCGIYEFNGEGFILEEYKSQKELIDEEYKREIIKERFKNYVLICQTSQE